MTPTTPPRTPLDATRNNLMPIDALGEAIAELAARIHAATYELLVMLREFDAQRGWNNGFLSCAHWLNWRTGIDLGAAREKVRVARALPGLPRISAAMQRGALSYAKVRAITRVATPAIRRALSARDTRCQFPACAARRCDAHHIEHWVDGGATSLDNLVLLCRRHHRLVHEGGFTVGRQPDRTVAFFYADGRRFVLAPPQPRFDLANPLAPTMNRLATDGITISPRTLPTWDGTPFNAGYAIDVLYVPRQPVVS